MHRAECGGSTTDCEQLPGVPEGNSPGECLADSPRYVGLADGPEEMMVVLFLNSVNCLLPKGKGSGTGKSLGLLIYFYTKWGYYFSSPDCAPLLIHQLCHIAQASIEGGEHLQSEQEF